jgi:hypothetical protein
MNDEVLEVLEVLADEPAPESLDTVSTATEETQPGQPEEQKERSFTQAELDAQIGKRLAREQRKWEREQQQRMTEAQPSNDALSVDQFESPDAYAEARAEQIASQRLAEREQNRVQNEIVEAYHDREEDARTKYDDFEQVAYNPNVRITDVMAETIQSSDIGPDLAYYLGSNPKEAERISRLSPLMQAKEIGRIEAKVASEPPKTKRTTQAPAPIAPVKAGGANTATYDTTDPRSTKTMSATEWIDAERARQAKKWAKR